MKLTPPPPALGLKGGAKTIKINAIYKEFFFMAPGLPAVKLLAYCKSVELFTKNCEIHRPRIKGSGTRVGF